MLAETALAPHLDAHLEFEALLAYIVAHSPYLAQRLLQHADWLADALHHSLDHAYRACQQHWSELDYKQDQATLIRSLRIEKGRVALLVSLADITGQWSLERITGALSDFAGHALQLCCNHLLHLGHEKGEIQLPNPNHPTESSGLVVLGMGKLGAGELNYSSDIDLMIFYERDALPYTGRHDIQRFYSRFALDLVRLMQDRTADGYVFRTDLRLRPDPASTPPAMSIAAALTYYETVGQNWERAAMIKARPVAGDLIQGTRFLDEMRPFIWRKFLDYAAIDDILSIKRQMHSRADSTALELLGHNIKTGTGGIREIEFFAQVHQLIWGGRLPSLRLRPTCDTLRAMVAAQLLGAEECEALIEAYHFFRMVEHRLQMVADEQTHRLPTSEDGFARIASFCGFADAAGFSARLLEKLRFAHAQFADAFSEKQNLSDSGGNLVFTGVDPDEDTLATLRAMGFHDAIRVWESIAAWHRGSRRATRTKRARELITEITPRLLRAIGASAEPDQAFQRLDDFVSRLPAGVQLFALLNAQPQLITLLSTILGGAPALAEALSRTPALFDVVLSGDVYARSAGASGDWLETMLGLARDGDEQWQLLQRYRQEQEVWIGLQLLRHSLTPLEVLPRLSDVAERCLQHLVVLAEAEFRREYGLIPGGAFAMLAMGRLGAREVCFGSDLDLVFVYDAPDLDALSDGERSVNARVYYNRLAQRLVTLLQSAGTYGRLYAVDTRLRPSGNDGHLAVSREGLRLYLEQSAWSFEYLAFCRARPVAGETTLMKQLHALVQAALHAGKPWERLRADVIDLNRRVRQEHAPKSEWDVKYAAGGLLEMDFLVQALALAHAPTHLPAPSLELLPSLVTSDTLSAADAAILARSYRFQMRVLNLLRLCQQDSRAAPRENVLRLLTQHLDLPPNQTAQAQLATELAASHAIFQSHFSS